MITEEVPAVVLRRAQYIWAKSIPSRLVAASSISVQSELRNTRISIVDQIQQKKRIFRFCSTQAGPSALARGRASETYLKRRDTR
jgi:hypothetical protein